MDGWIDGWLGFNGMLSTQETFARIKHWCDTTSLLEQQSTNDRKVAGSRPTKVVCITVLTGNRMGWIVACGRPPLLLPSCRKLEFRLSALMDSDLAWVNGKSGRQSWRYADAFQRSVISEAIYHFLLIVKQKGTRSGDRSRIILQTNIKYKRTILHWQYVIDDIRRMGRWSFWSWFDVNRSTFDEDMIREWFSFFSFPVTLTFAPLATLVQRYVFTKLEVSRTFLFRENRRHGTDGRSKIDKQK